MSYTDLMIDLETLGTRPGSVITQIGLCAFNAQSKMEGPVRSKTIYISPDSCLSAGLTVQGSTLAFWLTASEEARMEMAKSLSSVYSLTDGLIHLSDFTMESFSDWSIGSMHNPSRNSSLERVWGNGSTFDITLLEVAANKVGVPLPWTYRQVRDLRTLADLYPNVDRPEPTVAHVAEHDAVAQAEWVRRMWSTHIERREWDAKMAC